MSGPSDPVSEPRDDGARSLPPRAHLNRYAIEVDEHLVFDPNSEWFSDVPLATVATDGIWTLTRGQLTDSEADAVTAAVTGWVPAYVAEGPHVVGVFTDPLGRTSIDAPGAVFLDDPRDRADIDLKALIEDRPGLGELRRRVEQLARTLARAEVDGLVTCAFFEGVVAVTNAPDRVG